MMWFHVKVETKRATPREDIGKPEVGLTVKKVFVGGVKEDAEDEDIKAYFEQVKKPVKKLQIFPFFWKVVNKNGFTPKLGNCLLFYVSIYYSILISSFRI